MGKNDKRPAIALFAYSQPGYACLQELLARDANIAAVFTHIDAADEEIWFDSVYDLAKKYHLPVYRSQKIDEKAVRFFHKVQPDMILSAYYRAIIPDEFLRLPRLGAFNLHGSLLPKYRGRACINWAVLRGEKRTGVTLHMMTAKADRGDIIAQEAFSIDCTDTGYDIFLKTAVTVRKIVGNYLPLLEKGTFSHREQDEAQATKFGRRRPADGIIDWQKSAKEIYNLIRSVTRPFPGAFSFIRDKKIFIWWGQPVTPSELQESYQDFELNKAAALPAGTIIRFTDNAVVKCGKDFLLLLDVSLDKSSHEPTEKGVEEFFSDGSRFNGISKEQH